MWWPEMIDQIERQSWVTRLFFDRQVSEVGLEVETCYCERCERVEPKISAVDVFQLGEHQRVAQPQQP